MSKLNKNMISKLKSLISLDNPLRLFYHQIKAILASFMYGFPSKNMIVIGVTGTNGKTTTSNLIAKGLREAGEEVFMFSTVNYIIGDDEYRNDTKMTSPDPFLLQSLLKKAKDRGCKYAVIETSSHAITMHRVWGINYDFAVLTNITQDHLDLHRTMQNYVDTKLKLFKSLIGFERKAGIKKTAILNNDSKYVEFFLEETYDTLYTYGFAGESNLRPENIKNEFDSTKFDIVIPGGKIHIDTKLRGNHNIYNILAATGVLIGLGINPKPIEKAINAVEYIPGRLEEIPNDEGAKIYIDYAHTPDALENVLNTIRNIQGIKRVITVFGATGDRDKTKRPEMGRLVESMSDLMIITRDDDYGEDTRSIINDILTGVSRKEGEDMWIIVDREDAIRTAIMSAREGDAVLVAGKGDENMIVLNEGYKPWSDRTVVKHILNELNKTKENN